MQEGHQPALFRVFRQLQNYFFVAFLKFVHLKMHGAIKSGQATKIEKLIFKALVDTVDFPKCFIIIPCE